MNRMTLSFQHSVPTKAHISNAMSSGPTSGTPTAAALQSLRDELKGNIFRNLNGLFAKNLEWKSWSAVVQNKFQETQSAKIVSKVSAGISGIAHFDSLLRFQCQPLSNTGGTPRAAISLETSDLQSVAGSTQVFGEFHHDNTPLADDDDDILRFCDQAQQVQKKDKTGKSVARA
ncbi:hypothetical protein B0T24DRAFT_708953 [Lasiosphaeria ovina]|uniref:Uncharacterized protein n=1 Tax=Lasiosphaeria ovina TaxID=92902 RepID=A0AAE0JZT1_9PEZI|nr:hypothetical protein B0T24DRAFT_708953 [Lasiosphaeria ovina]